VSTDLRDDGDFIDPTYCYRSLTAAIDDLRSPLRRYLSATFPHTRPSTTAYRKASGPLLVPGNAANPGTVGTAFDYLARLTLRPGEGLAPAYAGVQGLPGAVATLDDVVARGTLAQQQGEPPSEALARACWALALCTEIYRSGPLPGHPVVALVQSGRFTADTLLELAPADAIAQLIELQAAAQVGLYPHLLGSDQSLFLGPLFAGSGLCPADADLIAAGMLIELKVQLGSLLKAGRADALSLNQVYQLLSYVLFDRADDFAIDAVGFYSARYGSFTRWELGQLMTELAGRPVDLARERVRVWRILGGTL